MAKFAILGVAARGHFNPSLPVIAELAARGHDVTVFNCAEYESIARSVGADFVEFPGDFSSRKLAEVLYDGNLGRALTFSREAAMVVVPWLNEQLPRFNPDVVVYDAQAIFGHISTKMLDMKSAAMFPYPVIEATRHLMGWQATLRSIRLNGPFLFPLLKTRFDIERKFGRETFPHTRPRFQSRGDITLMLTSPVLQRPDAYRDDSMFYVGPCIEEKSREDDFPWDKLDERPLIYISMGTLVTSNIEFFRTAIAVLKDLPAQFVMSIGQLFDVKDLGEIPDNFIVRPYVPQLQILKRASMFVTHAGFTGFQEALWYGVPMVAIPQQLEQLMNGRLAGERGACISIEDSYMGKPVDGTRLRQAVEQMLGDPSYRAGAKALGDELRGLGGATRAAKVLEAFVETPGHTPPPPAIGLDG
ncbi:nucleotide disphospho-sugar-binding domain-containing protein [Cucumibacter marinus]|uniref:nucleotide disphospho-sugar-binding domain-containing protein n=1 Tax=Cucumibacter marinus TaxID=1121252 RepID=UPI00040A0E41|nr:nucleotide disphospho-sugar-binding domain-containing protein [Cucumibacter marinus]